MAIDAAFTEIRGYTEIRNSHASQEKRDIRKFWVTDNHHHNPDPDPGFYMILYCFI